MSIEQTYRRFKISASVSPLPANRGLATVQVTTDDPQRIAYLGTAQFIQLRKWLDANDPSLLEVVLDECKVAIDNYADNAES